MNECIAGFACLDDHHLFMGLYITTMGSWIHGLMGLMDFMDDGSERRPTLMWWR